MLEPEPSVPFNFQATQYYFYQLRILDSIYLVLYNCSLKIQISFFMLKKSFLFILLLSFLALTTQAQLGIYYQAVARSTDGTPLINKAINVKFLIHDTTATGKVVYSEKHNVTTDILGMFSVVVGQGSVLSGTFSSINWGASAKFVQQDLDTSGTATQFFTVGTQQLMSVPYALYAYNGLPNGKFDGDMLVWKYGKWESIQKGKTGQYLALDYAGLPSWQGNSVSALDGLITTSVYNVTDSVAFSGGEYVVYNASGSYGLSQGICWSTTPNPTVALATKTVDSARSVSFGGKMSGLTPNTTYYVRAYATTSAGTTYGNEISFLTKPAASTATFHIGQFYGGGYIFYIDNSGKHGLIMDTANLVDSSTYVYSGQTTTTMLKWTADPSDFNSLYTSAVLGAGAANSATMMTKLGADCTPVYLCRTSKRGGYTDWYLPSLKELSLLYRQHYLLNNFLKGSPGFWCLYHTSTTQGSNYTLFDFDQGQYVSSMGIYEQGYTRAIRSF